MFRVFAILVALFLALPALAAPRLKEPDVRAGFEFRSLWADRLTEYRVFSVDRSGVDLRWFDPWLGWLPYTVSVYNPNGYPVIERRPTAGEVQDLIERSKPWRR